MKKMMLVLGFIFCFPMISYGAGYVLANYADGGDIHESSYGIELGAIFLSDLHPNGGAVSIGVGVSLADTDESPPSSRYSTGEYNDGNEQEIDLVLGAEIVPAFFGVVGVGYSSQDVIKPSLISNDNEDTETNTPWLAGVRYAVESFNMGVGYNSRRGIMVSLGLAF